MARIPEGFHSITPQICVANGDKAIAHYGKALGATELYRMNMPGSSKIVHACLQIGTSKLFLMDEVFGIKDPRAAREARASMSTSPTSTASTPKPSLPA